MESFSLNSCLRSSIREFITYPNNGERIISGFDINSQFWSEPSYLSYALPKAVYGGHIDLVNIYLDRLNNHSKQALNDAWVPCLNAAARAGNVDFLSYFCTKVNRSFGEALYIAAANGRLDAVKFLSIRCSKDSYNIAIIGAITYEHINVVDYFLSIIKEQSPETYINTARKRGLKNMIDYLESRLKK